MELQDRACTLKIKPTVNPTVSDLLILVLKTVDYDFTHTVSSGCCNIPVQWRIVAIKATGADLTWYAVLCAVQGSGGLSTCTGGWTHQVSETQQNQVMHFAPAAAVNKLTRFNAWVAQGSDPFISYLGVFICSKEMIIQQHQTSIISE